MSTISKEDEIQRHNAPKATVHAPCGAYFRFGYAFGYTADCREISLPVCPGSFLLRLGEIRLNVRRELLQVERLLVQDPLDWSMRFRVFALVIGLRGQVGGPEWSSPQQDQIATRPSQPALLQD